MMNKNPILVVDDDRDDLELIRIVADELKIENQLLLFDTGKKMMDYMLGAQVKPALIICDINMPEQNGYEVKLQLDTDERIAYKHISFVYLTTTASEESIKMAANFAVQGFYTKPTDYRELRQTLESIFQRFA